MHHVARVKLDDVNPGDLLEMDGGYVVADTPSARATSATDPTPVPFWYDTDGGRHYPDPTDGTLTVRVATFRTHAHGVDGKGIGHALIGVPGMAARGYCEGARDAELSVWESGTALSAVTCPDCRRALGLVNAPRGERKRQSNGI